MKKSNYNFDQLLQQPKYYVGIDYGTFRSVTAYKKEGSQNSPQLLSGNGKNLRTLFWCGENGSVKVCEDVVTGQYLTNEPNNVVKSAKILLEKTEDETMVVGSRSFTTDDINEAILRHIFEETQKSMKNSFLPEPTKICIGVPGTFRNHARMRIKAIIKKIGFDCELLTESQAAALYYVYASRMIPTVPVFVLDMGAGTFDVSVMTLNPMAGEEDEEPFVILDNGSTHFAGDKVDRVVLNLIFNKLKEIGYKGKLPEIASNDFRILLEQAREFKELLSSKKDEDIDERLVYRFEVDDGRLPRIGASRREFEEAIRDEVILPNVRLAYDIAQRQELINQPMKIVMVGGSSNIPLLRTEVKKAFSWLDDEDILFGEPDNAVALGCTLYAEEPPFRRNVESAYGFRINVDEQDYEGHVDICIPSNIPLPFSHELHYRTLWDKQKGVQFDLYEFPHGAEGDRISCAQCKPTHFSVLHMFPHEMPSNTPVDAVVTLNSDGFFELKVLNDEGGACYTMELHKDEEA